MLKLLCGVIIEVVVAIALAGLVLALAMPVISEAGMVGHGNPEAAIVITSVLGGAIAIALFRPRSALRRFIGR